MKILAFAGSNSKNSINKKLVTWVTTFYNDHEVDLIDLNDYEMPLFGVDLESEQGIPQLAYDFADKIDASDFIIMSLAEHNSSYTVAFKNVFDWVSRISDRKVLGDKPIFLMATSPGGRGGKGVLTAAEQRFPFSGGKILEVFSLPNFNEKFNEDKGVVDEVYLKEIEAKIENTKQLLNKK